MRRAASELLPWIEELIQGYDGAAGVHNKTFTAQIVHVDWLTPSQEHLAPGPKELLYMSDGVVHIPALLTPEAAQQLLDVEERENLSKLRFATVYVHRVQLLFYADAEETRSRFYLTVGSMATVCICPRMAIVRSCSELRSVQRKTSMVWRRMIVEETVGSKDSQSMMDLSELLWEWEQDSLKSLYKELYDWLRVELKDPSNQRPSTSTSTAPNTQPQITNETRWDVDRSHFKNSTCFSVPVKFLLTPEEGPQPRPHTESSDDRLPETQENPENPETLQNSEPPHPSVDEDRRWTTPAVVDHQRFSEDLLQESSLLPFMVTRVTERPVGNQWDLFPPPCETSLSSDASGDNSPRPGPSAPGLPAEVTTSTQNPTWQPSDLPPYQNLPPIISPLRSTSGGPAEAQTSSSVQELSHGAETHEHQQEERKEREEGRRKRKRSDPAEEDQESPVDTSLPPWISETLNHTRAEEAQRPAGQVQYGRPDCYRVTQQNIDDFNRFRISESLQRWAVQYLLAAKQT